MYTENWTDLENWRKNASRSKKRNEIQTGPTLSGGGLLIWSASWGRMLWFNDATRSVKDFEDDINKLSVWK